MEFLCGERSAENWRMGKWRKREGEHRNGECIVEKIKPAVRMNSLPEV